MSSGTLPLSAYHRARSLGSGTYGSVMTVYNDDGEEFALKLFLDDEEDGDDDDDEAGAMMDVGALREISILRLLRCDNSHPNIVEMSDVKSEEMDETECGAGTVGGMGIAMPLFKNGTLADAIQKGLLMSRKAKVAVAHGLLCAVAHLHDNGIIHRDIKCDNVMIGTSDDGRSIRPVLIDFSLAKIVNGAMYGKQFQTMELGETHTGEVGTVTYIAPEVVAKQPYGLKSDLWSVGVVLLEMLNGLLPAEKNKEAERLITNAKETLPDQPLPNLIRALLEVDPKSRTSAREALSSPVFDKFGFSVPPVRIVNVEIALPVEQDESEVENVNTSNRKGSRKNNRITKRVKSIQKICTEIGSRHPLTSVAAVSYAQQLYQLDDTIDSLDESQGLLDCVLLASRFFEVELVDPRDLEGTGSFQNWSSDEYLDNEGTLWMLMDYCLLPRGVPLDLK